jgi:hypothetical protein
MQLSEGISVLTLAVAAVLGSTTPAHAGQISTFDYSLKGKGGTPFVPPAAGVSSSTPVFFSFSYSMPGFGATPLNVSASGILTAFQIDVGTYMVSEISGARNGENILGIVPPGGFGLNDNVLFGTNPHLTGNGLTYTVNGVGNDGNGNVNVFALGLQYTELSPDVGITETFNLSQIAPPSDIPEPASFTLVCCGFAVVFFLLRRRSRGSRSLVA